MIAIQKGVPMPLVQGAIRYPWPYMAVGDMFEVPPNKIKNVRRALTARQKTSGCVYRTRKLANGNLGVWRTA